MNDEHPLLTLYRIEMLANNINEMLTRYAEATAFALDEKEKELLIRVKNSLDAALHNAKFFALLAGAGVGV